MTNTQHNKQLLSCRVTNSWDINEQTSGVEL